MVTSAIFAPHPGLIVPQETGAEKPEAECKSLDSTDSETIPSGMFAWIHSWTDFMTSRLPSQCYKTVLSFAGALKTDHTEVLLSADFTGAIKVFINVKKYWALQRFPAPHVQACLSEISPKDEGQPVRGHLTSPNYLMVIALRQRAVCSYFGRTGTLKWKTREWVEEMDLTKQTGCDSLSHFFIFNTKQLWMVWRWERERKKKPEMPSVCGLSRNYICSDMYA